MQTKEHQAVTYHNITADSMISPYNPRIKGVDKEIASFMRSLMGIFIIQIIWFCVASRAY